MHVPLRHRLTLSLFLAAAQLLFAAASQAAVRAEPVVLHNAQPAMELGELVDTWLEPGQSAGITDAANTPASFSAHQVRQPHGLRTGKTLWIRLRVLRNAGETGTWNLDIPVPYLDSATLYQRDFSGRWTTQTSGDTLPHARWSQQGFNPAFRLKFAGDEPQEVFLQIRNMSEVAVPIRFVREGAFDNGRAMEGLAAGLVLGLLLTIAGISMVRFVGHREWLDLGAVGYALLVAFVIAQVNGVLNASVWAEWPMLGNYLTKMASVLGVGGSLLFMRHLYALSIHYHRFDKLLGATGWITLASAFAVFVLEPDSVNHVESLVYVLSTSIALVAALLSWRQKSLIWPWLILATVPQSLGILWLAAESLSLVQPVWEMRYYTSLCAGLSVAVLAYALRCVTQDRQDRIQRAKQLATQDALTGLLNREAFDQQLALALTRVQDHGEPVALVLVSLINYPKIVGSFGHAIGEQCELRAVVKLHRVLRDVDPASRIGTGKFALLLEGVSHREQLTRRMVKLIASGLTPQPGLYPPVPLQFHVACAMLHERPFDAVSGVDDLLELVAGITVGTRRPIRFLEARLPVSLLDQEAEAQESQVTSAGSLEADISVP